MGVVTKVGVVFLATNKKNSLSESAPAHEVISIAVTATKSPKQRQDVVADSC